VEAAAAVDEGGRISKTDAEDDWNVIFTD